MPGTLTFSLLYTKTALRLYMQQEQTRVAACRGRLRLKCDGTCAETRFNLSAKRTSLYKSTGASDPSTNGNRVVHISGSNAG